MNLADAIRTAAVNPYAVGTRPKPAMQEEPLTQDPTALSEEEAATQEVTPPQAPDAPLVSNGNVVRLELFLTGEQMSGMLRALMAGQHTVLTAREAAGYLRIAPNTLVELAEAGEIPGVYLDNKWRFPKANLDEWMTLSATKRSGTQLEDTENVA